MVVFLLSCCRLLDGGLACVPMQCLAPEDNVLGFSFVRDPLLYKGPGVEASEWKGQLSQVIVQAESWSLICSMQDIS